MASTGSSRHVEDLAKPKPVPPGFIRDRRSVYWPDRRPPVSGPGGTTEFTLTSRQEQLAQYKAVYSGYQGDRPSPQWPVSGGAKNASSSSRVEQLAQAKLVHSGYRPERPVYTIVPRSALNAAATPRLEQLAAAKQHHVLPIIDPKSWDWSDWDGRVSDAAKRATASERVETLAQPKVPHFLYQGQRPIQWDVSDMAKKASASVRLVQLSRPKSRALVNDDYDPYKVSFAARRAMATPRVNELCEPIPRKVRQKKVI